MDPQQLNIERFNQAASEYLKNELRTDEEQIIKRYFPNAPAKILVVGCGAGRVVFPLEQLGYEVIGCDLSTSMIELAQTQKQQLNSKTEFLIADAASLDTIVWPHAFDIIWFPFHSLCFVSPLEHHLDAIKAAAKLLAPSGKLIYNLHNRLFPRTIWQWLKQHRETNYAFLKSKEGGLWSYTCLPWQEKRQLESVFAKVTALPRFSLIPTSAGIKLKERVARLVAPLLDKSFYFISEKH